MPLPMFCIIAGVANSKKELQGAPGTVAELEGAVRDLYKGIPQDKQLAIKWVDEDGDHVSLSSDVELKEALAAKADSLTFVVGVVGEAGEALEAFVRAESDGEWVMVSAEEAAEAEANEAAAAQAPKEEASAQSSAGEGGDAEVAQKHKTPEMQLQTKMADPETWTKMLMLGEMGFGENYDYLLAALQANNMDVAATAEALARGPAPAEPQPPRVVV